MVEERAAGRRHFCPSQVVVSLTIGLVDHWYKVLCRSSAPQARKEKKINIAAPSVARCLYFFVWWQVGCNGSRLRYAPFKGIVGAGLR